MVLLDDKIYKETVELVLGRKRPTPIVNELSEWLFKNYSIRMLNFQFNKLDYPGENRYRLFIILKDTKDIRKMHIDRFRPNPDHQQEIAIEFLRLLEKYNYDITLTLSNLLVVFNDFSQEAMTDANLGTIDKARQYIKNNYNDVWHVEAEFEQVITFYFNDNDIYRNKENGISQKIKLDYYKILKEKDQLNYYNLENFIMIFDSKENLDKNYSGNLFYYSRR